MGTVQYFSPEQGQGERCDHRSDIYSLGVVYFQLLTGRLPFIAETTASLIYQHVHTPPPPPRRLVPTLSLDAEAIVLRCLDKSPANRYQTAAELAANLERLIRGERVASRGKGGPIFRPLRLLLGFGALAALIYVLISSSIKVEIQHPLAPAPAAPAAARPAAAEEARAPAAVAPVIAAASPTASISGVSAPAGSATVARAPTSPEPPPRAVPDCDRGTC